MGASGAAVWADLTPETAEGLETAAKAPQPPAMGPQTPAAVWAGLRYLESFGFRLASRPLFDGLAPQAGRVGIAETPGGWGVYDPCDDSEGWALVGDDPAALVAETVANLQAAEETAPRPPAAEVATYTAPEFWAPGLINGDWTGTERPEREAAEAWAATLGGPIVSAEAAGFLWRHDAFSFWPFGTCAAVFSVLSGKGN